MSYVYLPLGSDEGSDDVATVGFYTPDGKWVPESDHNTDKEAAQRVALLNGGNSPELLAALKAMVADMISHAVLGMNAKDHELLRNAEAAIAKAEGQ